MYAAVTCHLSLSLNNFSYAAWAPKELAEDESELEEELESLSEATSSPASFSSAVSITAWR